MGTFDRLSALYAIAVLFLFCLGGVFSLLSCLQC